MKSFGIFIGYAPEQAIRKEGIGRLLAFVLKGALMRGDLRVTIAAPRWYQREILELLDDHDIDQAAVEYLFTSVEPYLIRLRRFARLVLQRRILVRRGRFSNAARALRARLLKHAIATGASSSVGDALPHAVRAAFLLPLVAGASLLGATVGLVTRILVAVGSRAFPRMHVWAGTVMRPLAVFKNSVWAQTAYEEVRAREFARLISLVNARHDIPVWFVPSLFWPEIDEIRNKTVVAAPDLVFLEFPTQFSYASVGKNFRDVSKTAAAADALVCYSEYVRSTQLVEGLGVDPARVSIIRHGATDMRHYLASPGQGADTSSIRRRAMQVLREYQLTNLNSQPFWRESRFGDFDFVIYASQLRPHKNVLGLIKAVERLIRAEGRSIKLILTANLSSDQSILNFLAGHRLELDVLSLCDVPSKVLASLNALATLAVNPTLFEGGFPFTFGEAYSVGTPSVMSDVPVVRELLGPEYSDLRQRMIFDPYEIDDMVAKIAWALDHRAELFEMQRGLFEAFASWDAVAARYIDTLFAPSGEPADAEPLE